MPATECESPRAAIQSWLSRTDSNLWPSSSLHRTSNPRRGQSVRYRRRISDVSRRTGHASHKDHLLGKKHRKRADKSSNQARGLQTRSTETRLHEKFEEAPRTRAYRTRLADSVGLRSPSRSFGLEKHGWCGDVTASIRSQRRRNSSISASSYLGATATLRFAGPEKHDYRLEQSLQAGDAYRKSIERDLTSSSANTKTSRVTLAPPEQPALSFERRPRHKTREDRYEFKQDKEQGEQESVGKKPKKRKRKEKSGAVVMHNFTAPNVSQDRLTLKPEKSVGLFGKGRASSPVRRRGLPDLAFSELAFLKSRRELLEDPVTATDSRKKRKTTKAVETDAEISRYFKTTRATERDSDKSKSRTQQENTRKQLGQHDSAQSFVDLLDRPFLGFGSCGANSVSPVKTIRELDTRYVPAISPRNYRSPTKSTSYLTWSQTAMGSQASVRPAADISGSSNSFGCQREHSPNRMAPPKATVDLSHSENVQTNVASVHAPKSAVQEEREGKTPNHRKSASAGELTRESHAQIAEHSKEVFYPSPANENSQSRKDLTLMGSNTNRPRPLVLGSVLKHDAQAQTQVQTQAQTQAHGSDPNATICPWNVPQELLDDPLEATLETSLKQCNAHVADGSLTPVWNLIKAQFDQPERRESHDVRKQEVVAEENQNHLHARETLPNDSSLENLDSRSNLPTKVRCICSQEDGSRMLHRDPDPLKPTTSNSLYHSQTPSTADFLSRPLMFSSDRLGKHRDSWKSAGALYEQQQNSFQEQSLASLGQKTKVFESYTGNNYTMNRLSEPPTCHYTHKLSPRNDQHQVISHDHEPYCNWLKDETQYLDPAMEYENAEDYPTHGHDYYPRVATTVGDDSADISEDVRSQRNNATEHLQLKCPPHILGLEEFGHFSDPRQRNWEPPGRGVPEFPTLSILQPKNRTLTDVTRPVQGGEEHDAALLGFWRPNRLY